MRLDSNNYLPVLCLCNESVATLIRSNNTFHIDIFPLRGKIILDEYTASIILPVTNNVDLGANLRELAIAVDYAINYWFDL